MRKKRSKKIMLQRETVRQLGSPDLGKVAGQACPTLPCTNHVCTTKNNCTDICSIDCSSL
jgi:hypothetical protein